MLPDRVLNPGPLTYESGALPIALRGQAKNIGRPSYLFAFCAMGTTFETLFSSLDDIALLKWGLLSKKEFAPTGANSSFMSRPLLRMETKMKNDRVAPPDRVPIQVMPRGNSDYSHQCTHLMELGLS